MKIIWLDISSFVGISPGAQHLYGTLIGHDPYTQVDLKHMLTAAEAARMNRKRYSVSDYTFAVGQESRGFESEEHVIRYALKVYQTIFPTAEILILGNPIYYEPMRVLAGPRQLKRKATMLLKQFNPDRDEHVRRFGKEWRALIEAWKKA